MSPYADRRSGDGLRRERKSTPFSPRLLLARTVRCPMRNSSCGKLAKSVPSGRSRLMRRPAISPTGASSDITEGTGTSATARIIPTLCTLTARTRYQDHVPVNALRAGPSTTTAPGVGAEPGWVGKVGRGAIFGRGRAEAHTDRSGRISRRSRKAKVWKSNALSKRSADCASTSPCRSSAAANRGGRLTRALSTCSN